MDPMKILNALKLIKDSPAYPAFREFVLDQSKSALAGMDGAKPHKTQQLSGKILAFEWLIQYFDHQLEPLIEHIKNENKE